MKGLEKSPAKKHVDLSRIQGFPSWPEHPLSPVNFPRMTMPRSTLWQRCSQVPPRGCPGPSCGVELRASPRPWLSLLPHPWPSQSPQPERRGKYSLPWEAPSPEVASVSVTETEGGELTRQWKGRCQEGEKPRRQGPGEADPARPGMPRSTQDAGPKPSLCFLLPSRP